MTLALRLGRSLRELFATVPSDELSLWVAYNEIEPIGDSRIDLGFGVVAAAVANFAGKTMKEGSEPMKPVDFMPLHRKEQKPQSVVTSVREFFSNLAQRRGGKHGISR